MEFAAIPLLITFALLFWWRSIVLFKRTVEDVPTSKVKGVFHGLNEVKGAVKSDAPLQTYLTERPSVWHEWSISEHWKKTESYRDKDGNRKTRTKSGWRKVDSGGGIQAFFLLDDTGELLIEPEGAKVDAPSTMSVVAVRPIHCTTGRDRVERFRIQPTAEGFPRVRSLPATNFTSLVRPN
tara:strand:+ start:2133 stop:2675 length:543 start_codon:yes stop_codon:yes gene_type:complete